MLEIIRTHSGELREDVRTFVRACTFNWLIGGADAHAQSFSMLIGAGGRNRLASLYDVASALVYDFDVKKLKLAIEIGGKYLLDEIGLRQWEKFATEARLPKQELLAASRDTAHDLPKAVHEVAGEARQGGLDHPVIGRLADRLSARSERCACLLSD